MSNFKDRNGNLLTVMEKLDTFIYGDSKIKPFLENLKKIHDSGVKHRDIAALGRVLSEKYKKSEDAIRTINY